MKINKNKQIKKGILEATWNEKKKLTNVQT